MDAIVGSGSCWVSPGARAAQLSFAPLALALSVGLARPAEAQSPDTATARGVAVVSGTLLDAPVSRTAYRLGPGDVLAIAILGEVNQTFSVVVTPEGAALIPGIGVAPLLGLNLDEAESRVRAMVFRYYRNVQVSLSLSQVRSFKVFVVGDVPSPGVRTATAATRVSEVLPLPVSGEVHRRNVLVRRASGDSLLTDLARFRQTGDLSANPTLREGDALVVPVIDRTVQVAGRVNFPGRYEYRSGESLSEFLTIANGANAFPANAADTIRLSRFTTGENRELHVFSRQQALGDEGQRFLLQPFDALYVAALANFKEQRSATIQGQVRRPGTYPIRPETTTVRDLVALAGGFTREASLVDATLRRRVFGSTGEEKRQLEGIPADLLSEDERRILHTRTQGDPGLVVIDFEELFAQGKAALDQPLHDGDVLNIPRRGFGVSILGAVGQPGVVQYEPGRAVEYYVERAGGYSRLADRNDVAVLKARAGNRIDIRDAGTVDAGDQIIVPFRQRRRLLERIQAAQAVIGTISGVVLTILAIDSLIK